MYAQQKLINRFIDWQRVRSRLSLYPAIAKHFPEDVLRASADKPPYYCHYMTWRLGTWSSEHYVEYFERMLSVAAQLENWPEEFESWQQGHDFGEYWSLLWQMQVAHFFHARGASLVWNPKGPDLTVEVDEGRFFVECYSYRKSYPIEAFVWELLCRVHPRIRAEHPGYLPFSLPQNDDTAAFLDELLQAFLNSDSLQHALSAADERWPHLFPVPKAAKNFFVYLDGDISAYDPGVLPNYTGDPESYLRDCLSKAVSNKQHANDLGEHRPNVLAINYLLGSDFYVAEQCQHELQEKMSEVNLGPTLDAILYTSTGVDENLHQFKVQGPSNFHPLVAWLKRQGIIT
jgi:hypothetical protein